MCIAILNTKSVTLKRELLNNCWKNNGDGAGILYAKDGQMQVFKEMKSFDNFYAEYLRVRKEVSKQNIVLHFRISTHGKVNETNCHPFLVSDQLGFVHNGMIYDVPTSPDYSDTYMFNEEILKDLKDGFEYNETILDMLESYIGAGSKLLFLNSDDECFIVNEKAGHWNMNCWFSNSSYKQVNDWVDYGGKKVKKSSMGYGSYNTYGSYKTYNSPGTSSDISKSSFGFHNDWHDQHTCEACDINLYGINEINRGMCDWCYEEQTAIAENREPEDLDICENCLTNYGKFDNNFQAHVCSDCQGILYGDEVIFDEREYKYDKYKKVYVPVGA
jgi:predicted glutamine amidotransferase